MKLKGYIYKYDTVNNLIAYTTKQKSNLTLILVGGLDYNIFTLPYTPQLYKLSKRLKFNLIIPQFRSHPNFSILPIESDVDDLSKIINQIDNDIILVGNSTGCQVILLYLNQYLNTSIRLCILQGPVSDTEYFESVNLPIEKYIKESNILSHNEIDQVPDFIKYDNLIYTRERFNTLYLRYNIEDLFSSYLGPDHYRNLNMNNYKLIFVVSEKDEYVINRIDTHLELVKNSETIIFKEADHFLSNRVEQRRFMKLIEKQIHKLYN